MLWDCEILSERTVGHVTFTLRIQLIANSHA